MNLINRLLTDAPFMTDGALSAMLQGLRLASEADAQMAEVGLRKMLREATKAKLEMRGNVAVIPIYGVLARKPDPFEMYFGGVEDSLNILDMVQSAARNPAVGGLLMDFDSPGGFYTGGPEVADAIRAAEKTKPTVSFIGGSGESLAYWMASQAGQVVASRSAQVGSIGAFITFLDVSKMLENSGVKVEVIKNKAGDFKAIGVPGTSLTDQQRDYLQQRVETGFQEFRAAVKSARPQVSDKAMNGQTFNGVEAKRFGLVDRVGNMSFALSVLHDDMKRQRDQ